jgi:RP/EB family microtubule-associated protein
VDGLERERDCYFGKLRDIEIMCQAPDLQLPTEDFVAQVTKILYATEDDFVSPDELEKENEQTAEEPAVDVSGGDSIETY